MSDRKCRGCGMPIEFIRSAETGKVIPAQRVQTVYVRTKDLAGETELRPHDGRLDGEEIQFYVSHFETCPYADRFSGARRS